MVRGYGQVSRLVVHYFFILILHLFVVVSKLGWGDISHRHWGHDRYSILIFNLFLVTALLLLSLIPIKQRRLKRTILIHLLLNRPINHANILLERIMNVVNTIFKEGLTLFEISVLMLLGVPRLNLGQLVVS